MGDQQDPSPDARRDPGPNHHHHLFGGSPLVWWILIPIAVALVAVVGGGVWVVLSDHSSTNVPTATAVPASPDGPEEGLATASPSPHADGTAPSTQEPTVDIAGTPAARSGSLPSLLELAPDRLSDDSVPLPIVASYADIVAWTSLQGMTTPTGLDDPALASWHGSLDVLALPTSLGTRGTEPIWQECYGFNLTEVHQVLSVGAAPNSVTIMTGDFERHALEDAWVRSGYQAVKIEGVTIWSLFPGDTIDLSARASRPSLGSLNNIVLLDDGTLIAAAKLSRLQAVLKAMHGDQSSLAQNDRVRDLIAPLGRGEGVISVEIARGDFVEAPPKVAATGTPPSPDGSPAATPRSTPPATATPTMPEVNLVLIGLQASSPGAPSQTASPVASPVVAGTATPESEASVEVVAIFSLANNDDNAAKDARAVMTTRLATERSTETGEPYMRRYRDPLVRVAITPGRNDVIVMRGGLVAGPADWLRIVETRDLGFAFWEQAP